MEGGNHNTISPGAFKKKINKIIDSILLDQAHLGKIEYFYIN